MEAIAAALIAGIIGFFLNLRESKITHKRTERLNYINEQIKSLYGPLFLHVRAGYEINEYLEDKFERKPIQDLTEIELEEWRVWANEVFIPLNMKQEELLLKNAHLLIENELPKCIVELITHTSEMKVLKNKWEKGDIAKNFSHPYPHELKSYSESSYLLLKNEQKKLIELIK
ncbi:MAG: hypothetical protein H7Y04_00600 [Verrucomicrobia bacterium]|nr:hypothetical protein [Cytophagales bacterium]